MNIHIDPLLPPLAGLAWAIVLTGFILHRLRQPYVVGYILLGAVIGPQGLGLIAGEEMLAHLGSVGVVLLLFFIGVEGRLERRLGIWKIVGVGTLLQIMLSLAVTTALGGLFDWPFARILLLGFVIALSSTAVVLKLLPQVLADFQELEHVMFGLILMLTMIFMPKGLLPTLSAFVSKRMRKKAGGEA